MQSRAAAHKQWDEAFKKCAAQIGLQPISEQKKDERLGHAVLGDFWDRVIGLATKYSGSTVEEVGQSADIAAESDRSFYFYGPQLWNYPVKYGEERPWLYAPGKGWKGTLYEKELYFDDPAHREFLRATFADLVRSAILASVKEGKSSKLAREQHTPEDTTSNFNMKAPAPFVQCLASCPDKDGHLDAASWANHGIRLFDLDLVSKFNGGASYQEVVAGFYASTDGGTKTGNAEPTTFPDSVNIPVGTVECLSCIADRQSCKLEITWLPFRKGSMSKLVPVCITLLGDRKVFAVLRPVADDELDRLQSEYTLWQFWKTEKEYTDSVFLAALTVSQQRALANDMEHEHGSGPLRRPRAARTTTSAKSIKGPKSLKRARGPAFGTVDEDDDEPPVEAKKLMRNTSDNSGPAAQNEDDQHDHSAPKTVDNRSVRTGKTRRRGKKRKEDLHTFLRPTTNDTSEPQYISQEDWDKATAQFNSFEPLARQNGRRILTEYNRARQVHETDQGMPAPIPCRFCAPNKGTYACRVYKNALAEGLLQCGHCYATHRTGCRAGLPPKASQVHESTTAPALSGGAEEPTPETETPAHTQPKSPSAAAPTLVEASASQILTAASPSTKGAAQTEPETIKPTYTQPEQEIAAAPQVSAQVFHFKLRIRSQDVKGVRVVSLTDSMAVEDAFTALRKTMGRAFDGREILGVSVDIPGDEDQLVIENGYSEDGWEELLSVVKEKGLVKLDAEVEAELGH